MSLSSGSDGDGSASGGSSANDEARSNLSGGMRAASPPGQPLPGWGHYGDFASPTQGGRHGANFTGAPSPMRMDFDSDSGSDMEVSSSALVVRSRRSWCMLTCVCQHADELQPLPAWAASSGIAGIAQAAYA